MTCKQLTLGVVLSHNNGVGKPVQTKPATNKFLSANQLEQGHKILLGGAEPVGAQPTTKD